MAVTSAAAACTATAIHKYTYTLGKSLYVPVTSRCNSIPLPSTRGPGFMLPRGVAETLLRVRDAEYYVGGGGGSAAVAAGIDQNDWEFLEDNDRVTFPPYKLPLVNRLYHHFSNDDLSKHLQQQRQNNSRAGGSGIIDDFLQPSIETLVSEVCSRLEDEDGNNSQNKFQQVVICGEGEPTLRMDALLEVARSVQSFRNAERKLPVRVITNGLCFGIPNFGYSPFNNQRSSVILPMHRHVILRDILEAGITKLSVALNTANRHEYDLLMRPSCHYGGGGMSVEGCEGGDDMGNDDDNRSSTILMPGTAHDMVCEFILEATKLGMEVDITGVLRPGIDREETERLAQMLLSAGQKNMTRPRVRWRKFFE